ncbi:MAG: cation transporter [Muribaculaceae bacterium]|nr:cation transporter [Muribaculaceae bacterium]
MSREKQIYRVTLWGSVVNALLIALKFAAGIIGNSAAMIADAVHSASDFITDIVVLAFVNVSNRPKDKSHDYGHGKYETLATTIIGAALLVVALYILIGGVSKVVSWTGGGTLSMPGILALWAALISILLKEGIFRYTIIWAKRLDSQALKANAWHHRSDALSSIASALGIGGAIIGGEGWAVLDPIASILVGLVIAKVAIDLLRNGVGDLMEKSLPDDVENEILEIAGSVPEVIRPHALRTRRIGNSYAIEMHILMDGRVSLYDAHSRASEIERRLKDRYGADTHVAIHVEPLNQQ